MPFDIVEKPGFVKFLLQRSVVKSEDDLPTAHTLSHSALLSVYDGVRAKLDEIIALAPKTVAMTSDVDRQLQERIIHNFHPTFLHPSFRNA
jgi:hypothetical protein